MKNLKKIFVILLMVTIIVGISTNVFATEDENDVTFIPDEGSNNATENTSNTNNLFNNTNNTNTNMNTNANTSTNTNRSQYNNTDLPKAGNTDQITATIFIITFALVALYAYKKIKDYNTK